MRYLIVLLCLFAFAIPADAQCVCGPACKCNPCVCNDSDETINPASSAAASLAALLSAATKKTDAELYAEAYAAALATGKVLCIGVGCDTPPGDWLSVRVETLPPYATGTVVVARGNLVQAKLLAGASTAAVVSALANPQAAYGSPVSYGQPVGFGAPMYGQPMFGGFGGFMGGFGACGPGGCK